MRLAGQPQALSALLLALFAALLHLSAAEPSCGDACHGDASCVLNTEGDSVCECKRGTIDTSVNRDGSACASNGWSIRYVVDTDPGENPAAATSDSDGLNMCVDALGLYVRTITAYKEVNCLYSAKPGEAKVTEYGTTTPDSADQTPYMTAPAIHRWAFGTAGEALPVPPTGMEIQKLYFNASCAQTGCWVVKGVVTTGAAFNTQEAFSTFFLPQADFTGRHRDPRSRYHFNYQDVEWTFQPANHPCASVGIESGPDAASFSTDSISACCISNSTVSTTPTAAAGGGFVANYRATQAFSDWAGELSCENDLPFPANASAFMEGKFKGMPASPGVVDWSIKDPFFGQFSFEILLDDEEMQSKAGLGKLEEGQGLFTILDTFLGFASFRPIISSTSPGLPVMDTFVAQTNIFLRGSGAWAAHGFDADQLIEHVTMRLFMVLEEDDDFSVDHDTNGFGDDVSADPTARTDRDRSRYAAYVQVTFTMGSQFQSNLDGGGLIPMDSVRAGLGTSFDEAEAQGKLEHLCLKYNDDDGIIGVSDDDTMGLSYDGYTGSGKRGDFDALLSQSCGTKTSMCASPDSVPDQFVSFNIPLGFDVFDDKASTDPSDPGQIWVLVHFDVNAVQTVGHAGGDFNAPNNDSPLQTRTAGTISVSTPIDKGRISKSGNGVTVKMDLKDVASVDMVVGSAADSDELARLRVLHDIASSDLDQAPSSRIDTQSIERGLITLVIKGNESYFSPDSTRHTVDFTMELDDVITLHLMEDGVAGTATNVTKEAEVLRLLATPGDDSLDATGLASTSHGQRKFALNGAFYFTIPDPDEIVAHLEPSEDLLTVCPFNPPRPSANSIPLQSCILRRDVQGRGYPSRTGAEHTGMEILAASRIDASSIDAGRQPTLPKDCTEALVDAAAAALDETSAESAFLARIFGGNDRAKALAPGFARAIHARYALNGRFRRAYWINPGYEWAPTQTAGSSIFSLSQKVFLFALISLDERQTRRRMLLQATSTKLEFEVTPVSLMANVHDVSQDRVGIFEVKLQLTATEACMEPGSLQSALRLTLVDYLEESASSFWTAQVMSLDVDMGDEQCWGDARWNIRRLLAGYSTATATVKMLVVFKEGSRPVLDQERFAAKAGIISIEADARNSPKIANRTTTTDPEAAPATDNTTDLGVTSTADVDCTDGDDCGQDEAKSSSSSSSGSGIDAGLIAGIAGGVATLLIIGIGVYYLMQPKFVAAEPATFPTIQAIDVKDLQAQLVYESQHPSGLQGPVLESQLPSDLQGPSEQPQLSSAFV